MVKTKSKRKRSASVIVDYAPRGAQSHMQKAPRGVIAATVQRRRTVGDFITSFVGLDVHKDSIAMAVAEAGRDEPRFLGTVSPQGTALHKALAKLGKPAALMVVYEAGPSGYGPWRDLQARGYRSEVIAHSKDRPAVRGSGKNGPPGRADAGPPGALRRARIGDSTG